MFAKRFSGCGTVNWQWCCQPGDLTATSTLASTQAPGHAEMYTCTCIKAIRNWHLILLNQLAHGLWLPMSGMRQHTPPTAMKGSGGLVPCSSYCICGLDVSSIKTRDWEVVVLFQSYIKHHGFQPPSRGFDILRQEWQYSDPCQCQHRLRAYQGRSAETIWRAGQVTVEAQARGCRMWTTAQNSQKAWRAVRSGHSGQHRHSCSNIRGACVRNCDIIEVRLECE